MNATYQKKTQGYFAHTRQDIVSLVPRNPDQKVLEVGAGACNTILCLKQAGLAKEVMGVELVPLAGSNQDHELIDHFQVADIRSEKIRAQKKSFDVIICADILEHLDDPWSTLKMLTEYLKDDGVMILSLPNIREWKNLYKIVFKGDFAYQEEGIMDRTHLRFFCRKNIIQLVQSSGLQVDLITPNFLLEVVPAGKKRRWVDRLTFGLFRDFLAVQYLVRAKKSVS